MSRTRCSFVATLVIACGLSTLETGSTTCLAADLSELVSAYEKQKTKVKGAPADRAKKAKEHVEKPLAAIAKEGSDEALAFLAKELSDVVPEIGALCGKSLASMDHESAHRMAMRGFGKRHPAVQEGLLQGVVASKRSPTAIEQDLVRAIATVRSDGAKTQAVRALGKLDRVSAAKSIVQNVRTSSRSKGGPSEGLRAAVVDTLKGMKSSEVQDWLAGPAFSTAGQDPLRLSLLLRVVREKKMTKARPAVEKLLANKNVGEDALAVLSALGLEPSRDRVVELLKKQSQRGASDLAIAALDGLAGLGTDDAISAIRPVLESKNAELRAAAMSSLGLAGKNPVAVDLLIEGVGDSDRLVRTAALRALRSVRSKKLIGPLIEFMGAESEERLRVMALKRLVVLTEKNMGLVVEDWRKWWEIAEARFELPKGEKGFTNVKAYDLSYFGIEVSSKRVTFVADISSSMRQPVPVAKKGEKKSAMRIDVLKRELAAVIEKMSADTSINLILFDAKHRPWQKRLQPLAGSGRAKALKFVKGISTGSGTNVYDSLEAALKDKRADTIYLLTDGQPSRGKYQAPGDILKNIRKINRKRLATIHCIGLGQDSDLLKKLASQNDGEYRFVEKY